MTYVQGFLLPVKTTQKDAYRRLAAATAPIFLEYGATRVVECWGADVMDGTRTDMKKAVQLEDDETVVFSWICTPTWARFNAGAMRCCRTSGCSTRAICRSTASE